MRAVRLITICIVLGLLTTIGLAWTCAAWVDASTAPSAFAQNQLSDGQWVLTTTQSAFGHTRTNSMIGNVHFSGGGFGPSFSVVTTDAPDDAPPALANTPVLPLSPAGESESRSAAGWPLCALTCTNRNEVTIRTGSAMLGIKMGGAGGFDGGWPLGARPGSGDWRALPYQPIWSGLVLDTLFFALVWLAIILGIAALIRARRIGAGFCPSCRYDLRGAAHERCPECGHTLARVGNPPVIERIESAESVSPTKMSEP